jgi:hypothetical protein
MLPIVKRKSLEVPHGLAAVAAAICLVLAFATDFSDRGETRTVVMDESAPVEFIAKHTPTGAEDSAPRTEPNPHQRGETRLPSAGSNTLINWFGLRR